MLGCPQGLGLHNNGERGLLMRQCGVMGIVANPKSHSPSIGLVLPSGRRYSVFLASYVRKGGNLDLLNVKSPQVFKCWKHTKFSLKKKKLRKWNEM